MPPSVWRGIRIAHASAAWQHAFGALVRVLCRHVVCIGLMIAFMGVIPSRASSGPLHPNDFASLGPSPFEVAGTYTVDTSLAAPEMRDPSSVVIAQTVAQLPVDV